MNLIPYCGDRGAEHWADDRRPHARRIYASDVSGSKTYLFNANGFRGEDLNDTAALRVFVCGASYAFGTGLDWEETWGYRLKTRLAGQFRLDASRVNLLNFSQSLASANYITRTLLAQCDAVRPDLVVAVFSDMKRGEYFASGAPVGVLPRRYPWFRRWLVLGPGWARRLRRLLPGPGDRRSASTRLKMWNHYARLYSAEGAFVNTLSNILLLQSFCRARGIDCLISWVQGRHLQDSRFLENPAIAPMMRLIDRERFCSFSIVDADVCVDTAADGIHPGPASNDAFAGKLVELYMQIRSAVANGSGSP